MIWDQIEGRWKRLTGSARERWRERTNNYWKTTAGKDQLVGRIQKRYDVPNAEAERNAGEWPRSLPQDEGSIKPTHARIADFWCRWMHRDPMWPSHGHYDCRTCGRRHRVCWEQPCPALPSRVRALPSETRAQSALETPTESRIQCSYQ